MESPLGAQPRKVVSRNTGPEAEDKHFRRFRTLQALPYFVSRYDSPFKLGEKEYHKNAFLSRQKGVLFAKISHLFKVNLHHVFLQTRLKKRPSLQILIFI
jgi:hypothetical protein